MADDSQGTPISGDPSIPDSNQDAPRDLLRKLRTMPLFATLSDEQFMAVSDLLRIGRVQRSTLLIQQGELNTNFYVLRHGRATVRLVDVNDREHVLQRLRAGDIFNEISFLTGLRNDRTVEALEELTLWYISRDSFLQLLQLRPDIADNLHYPPDLPVNIPAGIKRRRRRRYDWQRPSERIVLDFKRHPWVFWRRLWPILLLSVLMLILVILMRSYADAAAASAQTPTAGSESLALIQGFIWTFAIIIALYTVYQFVDWQNDYYVVTDQRIVHRERTLLIYDQQTEVQMNKVQDVTTERPSLLSWLLDFGDITVDASGSRAKVRFTDVADPDRVMEVILAQSSRSYLESRASQRNKVRAELINELNIVPSKEESEQPKPKRKTKRGQLPWGTRKPLIDFRNTFAPRMRMVEGDRIIYRKHWLQLVEGVGLPLAIVLVYVALLTLVRLFDPSLTTILLGTALRYVVIVVGVGLLFWALYRYEDWRNDLYILTLDRIIDIDRAPFGLGRSSRREARFSAVQNVNLELTGLWDNAVNMGDVIVQTAGAEGTLTFERVHDPHRVQKDIQDRVDAFESRAREHQATERRREFAEWVGIYDELKRLYGDAQNKS